MTKPTKLPTWATSSPNILEPSDGKKAQGWVPGEQPPASFFNYWQGLAYEWIKYFDENVVIIGEAPIIGDVQVNGTLGVAGDTTIGTDGAANLQVNGTLTATGLATVAGLASTGDATVGSDGSGNLQVNGTLTATGLTTLASLQASGSITSTLGAHVGGDLDVDGNADVAGGNLRVLNSHDLIVTGNIVNTKTRNVPVPLGAGQSDFVNIVGATYGCLRAISSGASQHIGLRIPANTTAVSIQVMHYKDSTASTYFAVEKHTVNWTTPGPPVRVEVSGGAITDAGWTLTTHTVSTVDASAEYRLRWAPASTNDLIAGVRFQAWTDVGPLNTP